MLSLLSPTLVDTIIKELLIGIYVESLRNKNWKKYKNFRKNVLNISNKIIEIINYNEGVEIKKSLKQFTSLPLLYIVKRKFLNKR